MSEWKPIETAPKDGTVLLGWEPDDSLPTGGYYIVTWWEDAGWARDGDDTYLAASPTHYMPLPPSPLSSEGK
jgi:hypothetical protein